jgi:hypothetical protein
MQNSLEEFVLLIVVLLVDFTLGTHTLGIAEDYHFLFKA